jgi:hypothetical protein
LACWRTESGHYRIIGTRPSGEVTPVAPTVEDGYLLITSAARAEVAA